MQARKKLPDVEKFAPGVWVEHHGVRLIAVPDSNSGFGTNCKDCFFVGSSPTPAYCGLSSAEQDYGEPRTCSSGLAGKEFNDTVRIMDEPTYIKLRIKGKL